MATLNYPEKLATSEVLAQPPATLTPPPDASAEWSNRLIHGDNLPTLAALAAQPDLLKNADGTDGPRLIYIDPPFATKRSWGTTEGAQAYTDNLSGDEFYEFLRQRIIWLHHILADNGTLWIHLDRRTVHYIRVLTDEIFGGPQHLLNEVIWAYQTGGATKTRFSQKHDTLLVYVKDPKNYVFNTQREPFGNDQSFNLIDEHGRRYKEVIRNGKTYTYWLDDGRIAHDVWHINGLAQQDRAQRTGYPTQKPTELLERVIKASSAPGDLVLDCFAGSGTTAAVAQEQGRRWITIDAGEESISTCQDRLPEATFHTAT